MKIIMKIKKKIKSLFFLLICLSLLLFQNNSQIMNALPMDKYQGEFVTEELRLEIPTEFKEAWLKAEKEVWEPWLSIQDGYLGRKIFWNKEREEALILVTWKSKKLWKSIPISEVNVVQQKFEDHVNAALNVGENPFKLIYEGELDKQR